MGNLSLCVISVCVYGGGNRSSQITAVKRGIEIVIGMLSNETEFSISLEQAWTAKH